jgi:pimeloyl-ACP methyl ester carboxylesterase
MSTLDSISEAAPKDRPFAADLSPEGSYARAHDGTRIYFESFSPPRATRATPALLLMGLATNRRMCAPAVRRLLAAGYEAIAVDNRGSGQSGAPLRPWTTRTMARDAIAVLDELGIERAHVQGASLGGMIAQELALEFPNRVSTLVLLSTTGGLPHGRPRLDWLPRRGLLDILHGAVRSRRPGSDPEHLVKDFLRMAASEDFLARSRPEDEVWEAIAAMLEEPSSQRGFLIQLLASARHSTWSRLERLGMPVQVQHGTEDSLVPLAAGRALARRIPRASLVVHQGAGHALFENLDEVGRLILAFIGESENRST